jgi:hypothetical protein
MFKRDNLWIGLAAGMLVPFVGYALLLMASERLDAYLLESRGVQQPVFDALTLQILALCLNLLPLHLFNKRRFARAMRGVMLATLIYAFAWMVFFGSSLFD